MTTRFSSPVTGIGWLRVTQQNPCPVCQKPDWCLISSDGQVCICARIESNHRAGDGGWLHKIAGRQFPVYPSPAKPISVPQLPMTNVCNRDKVYQALLSELKLSDEHRSNLLARGLTPQQIESLQYVSLTVQGRAQIVNQLIEKGFKMAGIPGFYQDCGQVRLAGPAGMVIPIRDIQKRIAGLQVRCDNPEGGKYKWISSTGKPYGCSSGTPIHVASPPDVTSREIWITEGALKADIAALHLNRMFLAVAGVGNWHGITPLIKQLRPYRVVIGFDMDKYQNASVRLHLDALADHLVSQRIQTFEADWDRHFKGIDDLLVEAQ